MVLIGAFVGKADELQRPGETIDAGDSYRLKDGSRVVLHRLLNEVAVKHHSSESIDPVLQQAGVERDQLASLASIDGGKSNIVDIYQVEDAQAVDRLLSARESEVAVFPVLMDPVSKRRMIATDEIIVQFSDGVGGAEAEFLFSTEGLEVVASPVPSAPGQYLVRMASASSTNAFARAGQIAGQPGVEWVEPNFLRELELYFIPNDADFGRQQYLRNVGGTEHNGAVADADVDAELAWDITTGHSEVVIAIIDTGVDIDHQELNWETGKVFVNPGEFGSGRETNGIDDDGNGYVDDVRGWDFYSQDNNPRPGSSASAAHGTACAGIAAARGNDGQGIAGIAYGSRILPIKINADNGTTFASEFNVGRAIRYAADYADVLSSSWGGGSPTVAINTAIDYAATSGRNGKGCGVFFASGNAGRWGPQPPRVSVNGIAAGNYRFGFYLESTGPLAMGVGIDQVRLLGADGYFRSTQPVFFQDFEAEEPGWTVAHGGGATGDWTETTLPFWQLIGTGSTRSYIAPDVSQIQQPGAWAELRTPILNLNQPGYVLEFARNLDLAGGRFQVRLLDQNDSLVTVLADYPAPQWAIGSDGVRYPANYVNSIAVGASTDFDRRADYSEYGSSLFCVAPSNMGWNDMATTDPVSGGSNPQGNYFMGFGGTSAATPLTAGVAALALSKNSTLTRAQLKDNLRLACDKVGHLNYDPTTLWNEQYGYGRANAYNSLTVTAADTTAPVLSSVVTRTGRSVEVTFSEKMGSGVTTPASYEIFGAGKGTLASNPSSVSWVSGYKYLLEWTSGEMIAGTGNITISVSSAVKDVAGNSIGSPFFGNANGSRVIHQIDCGPRGAATEHPIYPFDSERNYWSGSGQFYWNSFWLTSVLNNDGTPTAVYETERALLNYTSFPGDIRYTVPNITSGISHTVRLYFFGNGYSGTHAGDVLFDVYLNDILKLSNFDLIGAAGDDRIGLWVDLPNIAASNGAIAVKVVPKIAYNQSYSQWLYNATISGIKVTAQ